MNVISQRIADDVVKKSNFFPVSDVLNRNLAYFISY